MNPKRIQIYVGLVVALAIGAAALQDWGTLLGPLLDSEALPWEHIIGWLALLSLGLMAETLTLSIKVGSSAGSTSSINSLTLLTSILLFGSTPTVLFWAITGIIGEFLIRRKETIRAVFNSAQYILATSLAGWTYTALGGQPLAFVEKDLVATELWADIIPFIAFGVVFLLVNHAAVSLAIALSEGSEPRKILAILAGRTGTNLLYDFFISPLAIAVAILYVNLWVLGLPLIILPIIFIRQAYQTIVQLQQANRDLLTVLVKAIETRDPYTSGHSLRVASLAVRIAETMGLTGKKVQDVETAAMLHDIGKIEAIYSEILRKPDDLSPEERKVIESHVTKGVELLEQLSSFSKAVIEGVRAHHERVDGRGYPFGLKGDQIPLAARIIKVCDAIDAMLSDRPYRNALNLAKVEEQLVLYSGVQFDLEVVKSVIDGNVLTEHQNAVAANVELPSESTNQPEDGGRLQGSRILSSRLAQS